MSEGIFERFTNALERNNELLEQLIAGRSEAIEQLKQNAASADAAPASRSRKKAEKPQPEDAGADAQKTPDSTPQRRNIDTSDDGIRKLVGPWMQEQSKSPEAQAAASAQVKAVLDHFGTPMLVGEKSTLTEEQRYQAHFFMERIVAGLPVDLSAEYDFDADPLTQFVPEKAAGGDFGIG